MQKLFYATIAYDFSLFLLGNFKTPIDQWLMADDKIGWAIVLSFVPAVLFVFDAFIATFKK